MGSSRRRVGWMAAGWALVGLVAPLCALACATLPAPADVAHHGEPPCHEQPAPAEPAQHDDCGCASPAASSITSSPVSASIGALCAAPLPTRVLALAQPRVALALPGPANVPPPDILRLASVLLI